jgi:Spy/CpxP family protein refolding chaperone
MKRFSWFLAGAALILVLAAPVVMAAQAKPASSGLKGEYAIMVSELKLDEAAVARLKEKVQAKDEALAAWDKENGEKLKAAQDAAKKAKEGTDKAAAKKAADEVKALTDARGKIQADGMVAIYAVLSPEQKTQWDGFVLYRTMSGRFKKAALTEDQQKTMRGLCAAAAKDIASVTGDAKAAAKAKGEVTGKLTKDIEALLTADQKTALTAKPADKPAAEKKPAAAAK